MPDEFCLVFLGQILALSAELETYNVEYFEEYIKLRKFELHDTQKEKKELQEFN